MGSGGAVRPLFSVLVLSFHPTALPARPLRPAPGAGTAPGKRPHPGARPGRPSQCQGPVNPSAPQLCPVPLKSSGSGRPRGRWIAGGGRGEHPLSPSPPPPSLLSRGGVVRTGSREEPTRASGPHTRPGPAPTHCSGRRPAGPAPWPPSGLHRDPRPLRPRRPGPGAAGTHLHRAHRAAAIPAAAASSSSRAAPAAAAALCSARRGGRGRGGEGAAARSWGRGRMAGAGPECGRGGATPEEGVASVLAERG